jgi:hypothetical protein
MIMSDKTVGIIGQKYEDRKTGKSGTLESRDDKYKTLLFKADDGSTFNISNSSFRSNWRKVKDEEVNTDSVDESPVEEEVVENVEQEETSEPEEVKPKKRKTKAEKKEAVSSKDYSGVTDDEAVENFIESIQATRKVEVLKEETGIVIVADGVIVADIRNNDDETFSIQMLPDLFTLTDWRGKLDTLSLEYKTGAENYLGIIVNTKQSCIPEILDIIEETVKDINVYGYTVEESEEEADGEN